MAENGCVALEKFKSGHFDLCSWTLDARHGRLYGARRDSRLGSRSSRPKTPVVALTAYAFEGGKR